jgi:hypothetical protein
MIMWKKKVDVRRKERKIGSSVVQSLCTQREAKLRHRSMTVFQSENLKQVLLYTGVQQTPKYSRLVDSDIYI